MNLCNRKMESSLCPRDTSAFAKIVTGNLPLLEAFYQAAIEMSVAARISAGEGQGALGEQSWRWAKAKAAR
jgi:hypothetical protein